MAKSFKIPFAFTGDKTTVPVALQPDGSVSYTQGFGPDYELDKLVDPVNAKDVPRDQTNQLFHDVTEAVGEVQLYGAALWSADMAPYPINALVRHNDIVWRNTVAGNSAEPGTDATWLNTATPTSILPAGYFSGFSLANDGGAPNTTISVAAGSARSSDNTVDINLANPLRGILQSSGAWAAGDNQNKLDTGARANNTWYHVHAIRRTSDGVGDILFSLSATAPTMPSGYSGFRRIGSVRTDASGEILGFLNVARRFYWSALVRDFAQAPVASPGSANLTLRVPTGVRVGARLNAMVRGENNALYIRPTGTSAVTLDGSGAGLGWIAGIGQNSDGSTVESISAQVDVITDTSGQVVVQNFAGSGSNAVIITTIGWEEL